MIDSTTVNISTENQPREELMVSEQTSSDILENKNHTRVGEAGRDIGDSTMMGKNEVTFSDLSQIAVPEDTSSYTAVPHQDFVMSMYKHADNLLAPKGFKFEGERYVTDGDGQRLFFVHHYKNGDSGMNMAMGCRNSYDKSMKAGIAFGSRVFVCDNMVITGDINIMRSHRGNAIEYLNEQIVLSMYKASDSWDDTRRDRDAMASYAMDEDDGFALMGLLKSHTRREKESSKRILTSEKEWKAIEDYWVEPQHEYEGGNRTLWAWYNSFTFQFRDLKPHEQLQRHASLHRFATSALNGFNGSGRAKELLGQLREADPANWAQDTANELETNLSTVLGQSA